jgi:hypothetical protein
MHDVRGADERVSDIMTAIHGRFFWARVAGMMAAHRAGAHS